VHSLAPPAALSWALLLPFPVLSPAAASAEKTTPRGTAVAAAAKAFFGAPFPDLLEGLVATDQTEAEPPDTEESQRPLFWPSSSPSCRYERSVSDASTAAAASAPTSQAAAVPVSTRIPYRFAPLAMRFLNLVPGAPYGGDTASVARPAQRTSPEPQSAAAPEKPPAQAALAGNRLPQPATTPAGSEAPPPAANDSPAAVSTLLSAVSAAVAVSHPKTSREQPPSLPATWLHEAAGAPAALPDRSETTPGDGNLPPSANTDSPAPVAPKADPRRESQSVPRPDKPWTSSLPLPEALAGLLPVAPGPAFAARVVAAATVLKDSSPRNGNRLRTVGPPDEPAAAAATANEPLSPTGVDPAACSARQPDAEGLQARWAAVPVASVAGAPWGQIAQRIPQSPAIRSVTGLSSTAARARSRANDAPPAVNQKGALAPSSMNQDVPSEPIHPAAAARTASEAAATLILGTLQNHSADEPAALSPLSIATAAGLASGVAAASVTPPALPAPMSRKKWAEPASSLSPPAGLSARSSNPPGPISSAALPPDIASSSPSPQPSKTASTAALQPLNSAPQPTPPAPAIPTRATDTSRRQQPQKTPLTTTLESVLAAPAHGPERTPALPANVAGGSQPPQPQPLDPAPQDTPPAPAIPARVAVGSQPQPPPKTPLTTTLDSVVAAPALSGDIAASSQPPQPSLQLRDPEPQDASPAPAIPAGVAVGSQPQQPPKTPLTTTLESVAAAPCPDAAPALPADFAGSSQPPQPSLQPLDPTPQDASPAPAIPAGVAASRQPQQLPKTSPTTTLESAVAAPLDAPERAPALSADIAGSSQPQPSSKIAFTATLQPLDNAPPDASPAPAIPARVTDTGRRQQPPKTPLTTTLDSVDTERAVGPERAPAVSADIAGGSQSKESPRNTLGATLKSASEKAEPQEPPPGVPAATRPYPGERNLAEATADTDATDDSAHPAESSLHPVAAPSGKPPDTQQESRRNPSENGAGESPAAYASHWQAGPAATDSQPIKGSSTESAAPAEAPPATAPAPAAPAAAAVQAGAAHDIKFQVGAPGEPRIEVRVTERGGDVYVAVRTPDSRLAGDLREDLPALATRLEQSGFHAATWQPAPAGDSRHPADPSPAASAQDAQSQSRQSGREQQRDPQDQKQRDPENPDEPAQPKEPGKDFAWLLSTIR